MTLVIAIDYKSNVTKNALAQTLGGKSLIIYVMGKIFNVKFSGEAWQHFWIFKLNILFT